MHQTTSNDAITTIAAAGRALAATVVLGSASAALGALAIRTGTDAVGVDGSVAAVVLAGGTLAAAALALGTALTSLGLVARLAGRTWSAVERLGRALTPRLVRRALVLGLGATLGVAAPATAEEPDLGWQLTTPAAPAAPATADSGAIATAAVPPAVAVPAAALPSAVAVPPAAAAALPATDPLPDPPTVSASAPTAPLSPPSVVVAPGDSLWSIAAAHLPPGASDAAVAEAWPAWYEANRSTVGPDPDLIRPGQVLAVPQEVSR